MQKSPQWTPPEILWLFLNQNTGPFHEKKISKNLLVPLLGSLFWRQVSSEIHQNQYIGCATYQIWVLSTSGISIWPLFSWKPIFRSSRIFLGIFWTPFRQNFEKNPKNQVRCQFLVKLICRIQIWCQFRWEIKILHFRGFWTPLRQNFEKSQKTKWGINY